MRNIQELVELYKFTLHYITFRWQREQTHLYNNWSRDVFNFDQINNVIFKLDIAYQMHIDWFVYIRGRYTLTRIVHHDTLNNYNCKNIWRNFQRLWRIFETGIYMSQRRPSEENVPSHYIESSKLYVRVGPFPMIKGGIVKSWEKLHLQSRLENQYLYFFYFTFEFINELHRYSFHSCADLCADDEHEMLI